MNRILASLLIVSATTILICSSLPNSESAELWDLIILLEFEKNPIIQGENPILHATIVDHAYKPLANVNARISVAGDSYNVLTDKDGKFMIIFDGINFKPQTYVVNVYAEYEEKIGMIRDSFSVKGHIPKTTQFENQLELMELAHSTGEIKDDQNDPIAMKLHNHYLAIQKELSQARQDEQKSEESQRKIEELRKLAFQSLLEELKVENPGSQTHEDSWKHERFIANLDDSVKDTITTQLNSTITRFTNAQNVMEEILKSGGSWIDARQAYLDTISITRDQMIALTAPVSNSTSTQIIDDSYDEPKNVFIDEIEHTSDLPISKMKTLMVNGTAINIGNSGTIVHLNINGTIISLLVNGTQVTPITNSTQN